MKPTLTVSCLLSTLLICLPTARAHDPVAEMAAAATNFLSALDEDQRAKATYQIDSPERTDWHYIPKPFEGEGMRNGLTIRDMRQEQRALAFALLNTGLSDTGFMKATTIMSLERVLWELENHSEKRSPEMYYVSIYGEPGSKAWGWSVEGHHLSINFTIADGKLVSATPNFLATNPGEVLEGPRKGLRVLGEEEDLGRSLVKSFDDAQRQAAVIDAKAPKDILTEATQKAESLGDAGLSFAKMNESQQKAVRDLVDLYVHRIRPEFAEADLKKIDSAGYDKIVFAWAGGLEKGEGHYYRVQGPTFILEYCNTQNNANHVHAVWRDFNGDFGRDILGEHLASSPH
ncbi:MAG: DUF3500 domain-containing protein [Akkermansiaceae bacterium]|nr:DUF3500 domain-containing protein [Akkermansiaceae bacterium]MCP5550302.1 DUF3500 domain-containing protein [Akkermansiaceae bacterium]